MDARGFGTVAGRLRTVGELERTVHTLAYGMERVPVPLAEQGAACALTDSCLLAPSSEHTGLTQNLLGFVDLATSEPAELDELARQVQSMSRSWSFSAGSVLVRRTEGDVYWSTIPGDLLNGPRLSGRSLRDALSSPITRFSPRYASLSTVIQRPLADGWRLILILAHPDFVLSLIKEMGLVVEYAEYLRGLHPEDPEIVPPCFYAAGLPLQSHGGGRERDRVVVLFRKGLSRVRYLSQVHYVAPPDCSDPGAWDMLRAEGNTAAETRRILSLLAQ